MSDKKNKKSVAYDWTLLLIVILIKIIIFTEEFGKIYKRKVHY